ncbi:MAG: DUF5615 family PIN-like protein [Planctomycetes bacterium]|nr:DUF5615 family PIN-like protein [Planctomycetota bacterium]
MKWIVDASLPRFVAGQLIGHGHEAVDCRDLGMGAAPDADIAAYALKNGRAIITADFDFGDIRLYPPAKYAGIVVVQLPKKASIHFVIGTVEILLRKPDILAALPGKLAIVDGARIRLR